MSRCLPDKVKSASSFLILIVSLGIAASGCAPPAADSRTAGPGGREQPLGLSPTEEQAVGRKAYGEVMAEVRGNVLPPVCHLVQSYARFNAMESRPCHFTREHETWPRAEYGKLFDQGKVLAWSNGV